ncbi:putative Extracellular solute-binding protein family 1 [Candidatus Terasakiella magnetica]|uniref:Putative Extracellular solute-binding protein family 1 n=1 Tax=Candidatus Terasakiella magnetica TaxID=1867952 RepID=A0A1C3RCE4_9PROT|nr:extracellular solute-binding protein [Candidatus Terasakiella magnetica]SCA54918.1 putative Extracellular solute-binding protein family 1 [Candidatus Terasakiella magnetica]
MQFSFFKMLLVLLVLSIATLPVKAEEPVLKIAGWDVYGDPYVVNKTIGYKSFEQKTGITIEFLPLSNLDDIISIAESEQDYDLFLISNEGIEILHDMGLVAPLDLQKIPQYQNMHPNLKYSEWSQFDSRVYAVPWAWGPTGLLYDTDVISSPDSWNLLWDPAHKGKVAMWDDVSMIWTAALSLGYTNVYSLTKAQLDKVEKKLLEFNKLNAIYYEGGTQMINLSKKGKLVAFNSWYNPSLRLQQAGKNFHMIIPKEGAVGMFDSYMISKKSTSVDLAYQYIDHQITAQTQKEMVNITGLAPTNIETLALLEPNQIKEMHLDNLDFFNRMLLWDHMPRKHLYEKVLKTVRDDLKKRRESLQ